jgi:site-specific recombinase XerD
MNASTFFLFLETYIMDHLPLLKKSSKHTVRAYNTVLQQYLGYLRDVALVANDELTVEAFVENIKPYLDWVEKERNCSIGTRNNRLAVLRGFLRYVAGRDPASRPLIESVNMIQDKKLPGAKIARHMSRDACESIIAAASPECGKGSRDKAMLTFLYETGMWVQELASMTLGDANIEDGVAQVMAKGGKTRTIPLTPRARDCLMRYIREYHDEDERAPLFYHAEHGWKKGLTTDRIRKIVQAYANKAAKTNPTVPKKVHPHLFRSSKAIHLLEDGMSLDELADFLGYENVASAKIYAEAAEESMKEAQ